MARRSPLPQYVALFAVPFAIAAVGAFGVRSWQNAAGDDTAVPTTEIVVVETTVPSTVPLPIDTVAVTEPPTTSTEAPDTTSVPETDPPQQVRLPKPPTSGNGAFLRPMSDADRRLYEEASSCNSLARPGTTATGCDITTSAGLDVAWVLMPEGLDVLTHTEADGPDVWNVVLRSNASPSRSPVFADVSGTGEVALLAGWRSSDGTLAVDIVEFDPATFTSPTVSLHLEMLDGRVSAGDGRIDAWSGVVASGGDPSQPTTYAHWTFEDGGPDWTTSTSRDDTPPAGQL
jgi:hypothetical protein